MNPRYARLAEVLTGFSTELKKGERVLIDAFDIPDAFTIALVRAVQECGAIPYVNLQRARITRELLKGATAEQYATAAEVELARMQKMQAYIAVRGSENIFETSDVPAGEGPDRRQGPQAGARPPRQQDQVGRAALAVVRHGPAGRHEHAGVRGFLLPRLHL